MGGLSRISSFDSKLNQVSNRTIHLCAGHYLFPKRDPEPYTKVQYSLVADWMLNNYPGDVIFLTSRESRLLEKKPSDYKHTQVLEASEGSSFPITRIEMDGISVGVVGVELPDLALLESSQKFSEWMKGVNAAVRGFRSANKVWAVLALSPNGPQVDSRIAQEAEGIDILLGLHFEKLPALTEINNGMLLVHIDSSGKRIGLLELEYSQGIPDVLQVTDLKNGAAMRKIKDEIDVIDQKMVMMKDRGADSDSNVVKILVRRREVFEKKLAALGQGSIKGYYFNRSIPLDAEIPKDPVIEAKILALRQEMKISNLNAPDSLIMPVDKLLYAGQQICSGCHQQQLSFIRNQKHFHAFEGLVKTKTDGDVTCIGCHSAGFGKADGVQHMKQLEPFKNVQCESCHGPGKSHSQDPKSHPFETVTADTCIQCHDSENSDEVITTDLIELFHCPAKQ